MNALTVAMLVASTHPVPNQEDGMRAMSVGVLAVAMVGCPDPFEDPFEPGDYSPRVVTEGCGTVPSALPYRLPTQRFESVEQLAAFALAWEAVPECSGVALTLVEADGFDRVATVRCGANARTLTVEYHSSERWDVTITPFPGCSDRSVWIIAESTAACGHGDAGVSCPDRGP